MRVVFMGTPAFAVPSLELLAARHDVALVVTRPDRIAGRGGATRPSAVRTAADRLGLPLLQPTSLAGSEADALSAVAPDVICVAAFGMLLPETVLRLPAHGCLNVHASLLPRHRGAAPIQRAILEGDDETGVSIMLMEAGLDTGPYCLQRRVPVGERYAAEIEDELGRVGASALALALDALEAGGLVWTPQDDALATYAAKITKDDVALLPDLPVAEALRRVRAATRSAPARACVGDVELTVVRARRSDAGAAPGSTCVVGGRPLLGFADGALELETVRPAGRGDMAGDAWVRGARLEGDACWRCTR